MRAIEFKSKPYPSKSEYIIVDGIADENSEYGTLKPPDKLYEFGLYNITSERILLLYNPEVVRLLSQRAFIELYNFFDLIAFTTKVDWWEEGLQFNVSLEKDYSMVKLDFVWLKYEHWAKPWSMTHLAVQLRDEIDSLSEPDVQFSQGNEEAITDGFGISKIVKIQSVTLEPILNGLITTLKHVYEKSNAKLLAALDSDSVLTSFHFPDEIKAACKQYLIYFAQFLADIGIPAEIEIKEHANETLFKVTPKDKNESFIKIREALGVYLSAPTNPDFEKGISSQNDVSVMQLAANVMHLKSQVMLAQSIIQSKEATIEMLQLSNYQYKQIIEETEKKHGGEEVISGIVKVKKYEGQGFSIDFAELFRRMKRRFSS